MSSRRGSFLFDYGATDLGRKWVDGWLARDWKGVTAPRRGLCAVQVGRTVFSRLGAFGPGMAGAP